MPPQSYNSCSFLNYVNSTNLGHLYEVYGVYLLCYIIVSVLGVLVNIFFLSLVSFGLRKHLLSPKRYLFLLSRALSDILCSLSTLCWSVLDKSNIAFASKALLTNTLHMIELSLSFWTVTGAYVALAIVSYVAAKHPFWYRTRIRSRFCLITVGIIWAWAILYTSMVFPLGGSVFFSHSDAGAMCVGDCQFILLTVTSTVFLSCYMFVPGSYFAVLFSLSLGHDCSTCGLTDQHAKKRFWRLGLNIVVYTLFASPIVMLTVVAYLLLAEQRRQMLDVCYMTDSAVHSAMFYLRALSHLIWNARTLFDPLITVAVDRKLRALVQHEQSGPMSMVTVSMLDHTEARKLRTKSLKTIRPSFLDPEIPKMRSSSLTVVSLRSRGSVETQV